MKRYHPHHIGGDVSQIGRAPYLERMREKGEKIIFPHSSDQWKLQCGCGNCEEFYKYRGRYYCGFCGWWYRDFKVLNSKGERCIDMLDTLKKTTNICSNCGKGFTISKSKHLCRVCLESCENEGEDDSQE